MRYILIILVLFAVGCSVQETETLEMKTSYVSDKYGFSLPLPDGFSESDAQESSVAFTDGDQNAILVLVEEEPISTNILVLGFAQAQKDLIGQDEEQLKGTVRTLLHDTQEWYTYAMNFEEKNIRSIVSGTVCEDKEVMIVLVVKQSRYEEYTELYQNMIARFSCG